MEQTSTQKQDKHLNRMLSSSGTESKYQNGTERKFNNFNDWIDNVFNHVQNTKI